MAAGATYTPIASTTIGTAVTTVSFSSISGTYTDLVLVYSTKSQGGYDYQNSSIIFNGDTSANYSYTQLYGDGSSAASNRQSGLNNILIGLDIGTTQAGKFSVNIINIMNYSNTTTYKTLVTRKNATPSLVSTAVGLWRSTAAITSMTISRDDSNGFSVGSTFALYGIAAA